MGGRERLPFAARSQRADIGQCSARTNPGYGLLYHATVQRVGDGHGCGQRQRAPTASRPTFPEQHQKQQRVGDVEIPNLADKRHHQIKHGVGGSMVDEIEQPDIALLEKFRHGSTVVSGRRNGRESFCCLQVPLHQFSRCTRCLIGLSSAERRGGRPVRSTQVFRTNWFAKIYQH